MSESSKNPAIGKGFIYILSNPSMSNIYKVGLTTNSVRQRIQELNSTGVPKSFELVKKYEIREEKLLSVERLAHRKLKSNELHHGKEFFEGNINLIKVAVEDAIFELTGETAVDLVGEASKRKAAHDRKIQEEREFQKLVQERLAKENQAIDEQRLRHINAKASEIKENASFMDTYIWGPIGYLFFGAIAIGMLATGPIGWIIVAGVGWWIYHEDHLKPKQNLVEEANRLYPYKTSSEIASLLRTKSSQTKSPSPTYTSTYPFTTSATVSTASSSKSPHTVQEVVPPKTLSASERNSISKAIRDRISDEINDLAKRDPGLWFESYQTTKNLIKRNQRYQAIREQYLTKKLMSQLPSIAPSSWSSEFDKVPHMSSYTIEEEISKLN